MSTATRRGLLDSAAAGVLLPALARGGALAGAATPPPLPPTAPRATQAVVRRGRAIAVTPHGDTILVAHDQRRTVAIRGPRGRSVLLDVGGQPLDVAVAPDGRLAAVTCAAWDGPGLVLVDLRSGTVRGRVDVGPAPFAAVFTPDGRRILVSGGEQQGTVHILSARRMRVLASQPVGLNPRGIAVGPAGGPAWIALNGDSRIVGVDPRSGRVTRELASARLPDRLALSPGASRLLLTHGGRSTDHVSELDLRTGRSRRRTAGPLPSAVAWTRRGRRLVALGGAGELVVLGARGVRRLPVSGAPRGLAVAGSRAWTVDGLSGDVDRVRV